MRDSFSTLSPLPSPTHSSPPLHSPPLAHGLLAHRYFHAVSVTIEYNGSIGDSAVTVPVGAIAPRIAELLKVTEDALFLGIKQAVPGNRIGDISHAVQAYVEAHGFSVVREMVGHGVGREMHEEPQIPNFGRRNTGEKIKPGMTLAIEPMVNLGGFRVRNLADRRS